MRARVRLGQAQLDLDRKSPIWDGRTSKCAPFFRKKWKRRGVAPVALRVGQSEPTDRRIVRLDLVSAEPSPFECSEALDRSGDRCRMAPLGLCGEHLHGSPPPIWQLSLAQGEEPPRVPAGELGLLAEHLQHHSVAMP